MINVIQAQMLRDAVWEKEVYDARQKIKGEIERMLGVRAAATEPSVDSAPRAPSTAGPKRDSAYGSIAGIPIVYDEFGKPRPAPLAYDDSHSDALPDDIDTTGDADASDLPSWLDPPVG